MMFKVCFLLLVIAYASCEVSKHRSATLANVDLLNDLFVSYHRQVKPDNVTVSLGLNYLCAMFDPATRVLNSRAYMRMGWFDERLTWDPSRYNGVDIVRVENYRIWKPDMKLYNSLEQERVDWDINVVVFSDGNVMWLPPVTYKSLCTNSGNSINCKLQIGSWTYDGNNVALKKWTDEHSDKMNTDDYFTECPYKITQSKTQIFSTFYACCEEPYLTLLNEFSIAKN